MHIFRETDELAFLADLVATGKKIVFTNGVFDLVHRGHVEYLNEAKALGDVLIVGLNSDESVKNIKGEKRPIINEENRAILLVNLKPVDYVIIFSEDTPEKLIKKVKPDVLVKGGDWQKSDIVGSKFVESYGGKVITIKFRENNSSSLIVEEIIKRYCPES
ncbi:MAG: D-glycero-beta-D-manno-heptose 1-phosphate adenylyltransferase [Ignavibacteria bacterium]|nr:D-glycero-beta-D-manno-heptose 1-phosphate adenylyltransferase [Ignavibacteria bacterium]